MGRPRQAADAKSLEATRRRGAGKRRAGRGIETVVEREPGREPATMRTWSAWRRPVAGGRWGSGQLGLARGVGSEAVGLAPC